VENAFNHVALAIAHGRAAGSGGARQVVVDISVSGRLVLNGKAAFYHWLVFVVIVLSHGLNFAREYQRSRGTHESSSMQSDGSGGSTSV
jgi:hypothetical protein